MTEQISPTQAIIKVQGNVQVLLSTLAHYQMMDLDVISQSLEDIFMHYYDVGGQKS